MKKKILLLIDDLTSGGAQRQLVINAKQLLESNFSVEVLIYHNDLFYEKQLSEMGVVIHKIFIKNLLNRIFSIRKFIREKNYDSIISYTMTPNFINTISGLPFKKKKVIVNERSANESFNFKFFIYRIFYLFSDVIITNSQRNMEIIIKNNFKLKNKRRIVLYNSIDLEKFIPKNDYEFKKNDSLNLLILSSHQYIKNLRGLIFAVNLLNQKEKEKLHISWYGSVKDLSYEQGIKLIDEFKLNSIFSFFKPVKNVNKIIQQSDVVGLFSFYEGFPNSIVEGMACGKPIICSKVSDIPKIIKNNDFLFSPENPSEIKIVLEKVINLTPDELRHLGINNRIIAENYFDSKNNNKLLLNIL